MTANERRELREKVDQAVRQTIRRPAPGSLAHLNGERLAHQPSDWWGERRHGTEVMYVHGGCRQECCKRAHREARRRRYRRQRERMEAVRV